MSMNNLAHQYAAGIIATAGVIGGAYYAYRAYQKNKLPTEWTQVGTVSNIYVYPIKSCGPVIKDNVEISILGPRDGWLRDRVLMVTDEKYHFTTARVLPELLLVKPTIKGSVLTLQFKNKEPVYVNLAEVAALEKPRQGVCWGTPVQVFDCGNEVSEWLTGLVGNTKTLRLVYYAYYASEKSRPFRNTEAKVYKFRNNDMGIFPDEVPYNVINEASIEDLNKRLVDKVTHCYFRPNFVVAGAQPYDEDSWRFMKIGDSVFEIIRPCARCVMTTIDPETGVRNPKSEPLDTLRSYRQLTNPKERKVVGTSPRMGVQMALRSSPGGMISLNEPVYIA